MIRATLGAGLAAALSLWALVAQAAVEIQEVTSPGGIEAWLVEERSLPFTALEIRIRGGANLDAPAKRGAANLMMALLEEGSGDMDARAFQEAREGLAASFGFEAGDDAVAISATMLTENRDEAAALLRQALVSPRFDADAVERVRGQVQAGLAQDRQDPQALAGEAFNALAFPSHPYGSSSSGTPETVAALTPEDLLAAHQATLVRDRVYVGAVGDISAEELGALLDDLLGALPATGPAQPPHVEPALAGGVTVIPFPTPQSVVIFGHEGIERDHPDFFAAYVLNHVLGDGGFESRLMQEVRDKRGLTYGIGTSLVPRDYAELWLGSFSSGNASVAEAVGIVRGIWADLAANGVTPAELDAAKTYLTGEYPLRFDGNANIAEILVGMQMIGLPPSYVVNRNAMVEAVTLDDVRRVAAERLHPDRLAFVVVGEPEGLASGPFAEAPPVVTPAAAAPGDVEDAPGGTSEPASASAAPEPTAEPALGTEVAPAAAD